MDLSGGLLSTLLVTLCALPHLYRVQQQVGSFHPLLVAGMELGYLGRGSQSWQMGDPTVSSQGRHSGHGGPSPHRPVPQPGRLGMWMPPPPPESSENCVLAQTAV